MRELDCFFFKFVMHDNAPVTPSAQQRIDHDAKIDEAYERAKVLSPGGVARHTWSCEKRARDGPRNARATSDAHSNWPGTKRALSPLRSESTPAPPSNEARNRRKSDQ